MVLGAQQAQSSVQQMIWKHERHKNALSHSAPDFHKFGSRKGYRKATKTIPDYIVSLLLLPWSPRVPRNCKKWDLHAFSECRDGGTWHAFGHQKRFSFSTPPPCGLALSPPNESFKSTPNLRRDMTNVNVAMYIGVCHIVYV